MSEHRSEAGEKDRAEERAREGLAHLQNAALELIEATRAFLDVAEELVQDPAALAALATTMRPPVPSEERRTEPHVEHIRVV